MYLSPSATENQTFTLVLRNVRFSVSSFSADPGENLTIVLRNEDPIEHTFTLFMDVNLTDVPLGSGQLPEMVQFNQTHGKVVDIFVPAGQTVTANFTAPTTPGRYTFVCMIYGHWITMNGVLQVGLQAPAQPMGPQIDLIPGMMLVTIVAVLVFAAFYHVRAVRAARRRGPGK